MYNVYMKYVLEEKDASASKGDLLKYHNYFFFFLTFTLATGYKMGSLSSDKSL